MTDETRMLVEWLRTHNYALCNFWKVISIELANKLPDGAVSTNKDWGSVVKCKIEVTLHDVTHNLDIAFEGGVTLLDSYKYFLLKDDFMVLLNIKESSFTIYKQNPVW